MMVSLDGYYEGPNGELDWHHVDSEFNDYAVEFLNQVDTLVMGRKTYEIMAAWWPTAQAMDEDPIVAQKMNDLKKLVASKSLQKTQWNNTFIISNEVAGVLRAEKQKPGKDMAVFGSSNLMLTLMQYQLVDEYRIMINPIILGNGKSLFIGSNKKNGLKLSRTYSFNSGNIMLFYHPQ